MPKNPHKVLNSLDLEDLQTAELRVILEKSIDGHIHRITDEELKTILEKIIKKLNVH